jgi:hypothetical protein
VVDMTGRCCPEGSALDASQRCCNISAIDGCGVCGGADRSCAIRARLALDVAGPQAATAAVLLNREVHRALGLAFGPDVDSTRAEVLSGLAAQADGNGSVNASEEGLSVEVRPMEAEGRGWVAKKI